MTAVYPKIKVYKKDNPVRQRPGMAGKIAVIGAFDSEETDPLWFDGLDDAYTSLGTDTTYKGVSCLDKLFIGASGIIAVNVTTTDGDTVSTDITTTNLAEALGKIKNEQFDMLFIAENLSATFLPIITAFLDERMENKLPAGYVGSVTGASLSDYTTLAGLAGEYCYGLITQQFVVDNTTLSLVDSGAYYMGVIAGVNVGNSMTKKTVPEIIGLSPEYSFEVVNTGYNGLNLLQLGLTTFECFDRENNVYVCVNSEQPNGYDLYINRVRDYVIREMSLHEFLGNRNRASTYAEIEQELSRVKNVCVNTLDLLEDIEYNVVKKSVNCVDVNITSLLFAGIITEIDVYFTIEVE